jgi:hypothetical protein
MNPSIRDRLRAVGGRIQRLGSEPVTRVRRLPVVTPVLRWMFARPRVGHDRVAALARRLHQDPRHYREHQGDPRSLLVASVRQLERGATALERAARLTGRVPSAELGWLWRLYQIVYRGGQLVHELEANEGTKETETDVVGKAQLVPLPGAETGPADGPAARAVDPLLDAARHELRRLGRKRRLLEAARRMLLQAAAAGGLDGAAVKARRRALARQIAELDRLQAAGLSPDVDLMHQARQARDRGDLSQLAAALTALEQNAVAAGQRELGQLAGRALGRLWGFDDRFRPETASASRARSQVQLFGAGVRARIAAGYRRALASVPEVERTNAEAIDDAVKADLERYLDHAGPDELLTVAMAADGCFELGGAASPVRSLEIERQLVQVRHPTQDLTLVPARGVGDLPDAVIDDPRTVLPALAAGTLLTRRYLAVETHTRERRRLRNDARFYLLDGSGSMIGPRARMRDALLLTELATLGARLQDAERAGRPVLYYGYFTKQLEQVARVDTVAQAHAALEAITAEVRVGGTDIEAALLAAFQLIREARAEDPDLVRTQLVLVTDGESTVDLGKVTAAREQVGDLPIGVSIIALGQENEALRRLAVAQRARGEPVFYQFMDDGELADIAAGRLVGPPIHLPAERAGAALAGDLDALLAEMEQRLRPLDTVEIDNASVLEAALGEVGLTLDDGLAARSDGERARREVLLRDENTVAARFSRWFPAVAQDAAPAPLAAGDAEALADVTALLATVAEVLAVGPAPPLEKRADAIEVMERLLADSVIPPWRYADLVRRHSARLADPLRAVHRGTGA